MPACLVLLLALPAQARVEPAWWPQPYPYVVVDQSLQEVLEAFGRNLGLPLDVDATVDGEAPARLEAATAGEFLEALARTARLAWFYDGNTLHVTPAARNQQQRIATGGLAVAQVQQRLDAYGVSGNPLAVRALPGAGGILASGSPAFVEWLRQRLETPPAIVARDPSRSGVRVFRGAAREETVPVRASSSP
ncbi:type III secretion protein [Pseudomonas sp. No.117]